MNIIYLPISIYQFESKIGSILSLTRGSIGQFLIMLILIMVIVNSTESLRDVIELVSLKIYMDCTTTWKSNVLKREILNEYVYKN